jgi:UDP-N-acetylmuramate dehydrogenase
LRVLTEESLLGYNTLGLQGRARAFLQVRAAAELEQALAWTRSHQLPVIPLGEGSNVVIAGDIEALVLRMAIPGIELLEDDAEQVCLRVGAGESWHQLVEWTLRRGYYGLENLALIPGTAGAAPVQNIGAYGVELASFVRAVHCVEITTGQRRVLAGESCEFGYRDSIFKRSLRDRVIITAVDLQLQRKPQLQVSYPALAAALAQQAVPAITPQAVFDAVVSIRRSKLPDPAQIPNAGSFFKNPVVAAARAAELAGRFPGLPQYPQADGRVKLAAAWLIDYCGWKGRRRGGFGVHPEHALVLVNLGGNRGADLLKLAGEVAASVRDSFGIALEIEPRVYGA